MLWLHLCLDVESVLILNLQILEQSRFAQELGAAVHLAPNSNGILRRLGIKAESFGANDMTKVRNLDFEYTERSILTMLSFLNTTRMVNTYDQFLLCRTYGNM